MWGLCCHDPRSIRPQTGRPRRANESLTSLGNTGQRHLSPGSAAVYESAPLPLSPAPKRSRCRYHARVPDPWPARGPARRSARRARRTAAARATRGAPRPSRPGCLTERLVDLLWGENAPKTATTSLQNAVSQLRRELGADVIGLAPPATSSPSSRTDRRRSLRGLLVRARAARARGAGGLLRSALELWRGRRSPTWPARSSPRERSGAWRSCGWMRSRSASRRTWSSASTVT